MTWARLGQKLVSIQSTFAAIAFLGSAFLIVSAVSKVPAKLEAHAEETRVQNDSLLVQARITNQLLRASLCIQIKAELPAACMLKP